MYDAELRAKLAELLSLPSETEWFEIKEAKTTFDIDQLGRYFSGLSNEANLRNLASAWFVCGVNDKKEIVGSSFRKDRKHLDKLKREISEHTTYGLSFTDIYELDYPEGRVVVFQIPAALRGVPTEWKGFFTEGMERVWFH